ncbi:MAG: vWA domain-containing protein, partial [Planctomycetota bacterium]
MIPDLLLKNWQHVDAAVTTTMWIPPIRFVGDLPLWLGIPAALLLSSLVWWWYRKETARLGGVSGWGLPTLRAAALFLALMILIGPMLHLRWTEGRVGRVLIFVDGSDSMSQRDTQMPVDRKLAIAANRDNLQLPDSLSALFDADAALGQLIVDLEQASPAAGATPGPYGQMVSEIDDRVSRYLDAAGNLQDVGSQPASNPGASTEQNTRQLLQQLRTAGDSRDLQSAAVSLRSVLNFPRRRIAASTIGSTNAEMLRAIDSLNNTNRWQRVSETLSNKRGNGMLDRLAERHDVQLIQLTADDSQLVWSSSVGVAAPTTLTPMGDTTGTNLNRGLVDRVGQIQQTDSNDDAIDPESANTAVVLISDGRHNTGSPALDAANMIGNSGIPIYTVGYGDVADTGDLAIRDLTYPSIISRKRDLSGTVVLRDQLPAGTPFTVSIDTADPSNDDQRIVLWQESLRSQSSDQRRVDYTFSLDDVIDQMQDQAAVGLQRSRLLIDLRASATVGDGTERTNQSGGSLSPNTAVSLDRNQENNERQFRVAANVAIRRIMLIDGRSRWETRYLRNLFERDPGWQLNFVIPDEKTGRLPRVDSAAATDTNASPPQG